MPRGLFVGAEPPGMGLWPRDLRLCRLAVYEAASIALRRRARLVTHRGALGENAALRIRKRCLIDADPDVRELRLPGFDEPPIRKEYCGAAKEWLGIRHPKSSRWDLEDSENGQAHELPVRTVQRLEED